MRQFIFSYRHNGSEYSFTIPADNEREARERAADRAKGE